VPINFTDKSLWNVAGNTGINNCNVATLGEVNSLLADAGVSVNYGSQGDLGKRVVISDKQFSAKPSWYVTANGTLYGGIFQAVYIDPGATVANLTVGKIAYLKDNTNSLGADTGAQVYAITDSAHADAVGLIAGICLTPAVTAGNYTIIQVHGKANVLFTATITGTPAVGVSVIAGGATAGTADVPTQSGNPTWANIGEYLGNAVILPVDATATPVQLKTLFGRY
jgi:hypothetical protein